MKYHLNLPLELEPYREKFLSTVKPFIKIIPQKERKTNFWESKIGGYPYLPKGMDFPTDFEGKELFFLAQINFSETPDMEPFPEKGILQFFINDDEWLGLDPYVHTAAVNFRVLYFDNLETEEEKVQTDFSWLRTYEGIPIEEGKSFPLSFELRHEAVPLTDYRIVELLGEDFFMRFGEQRWGIMDAYSKLVNSGGHKLGGYAFFAQQDPRYHAGPMELLFQLDSDPNIHCMWGDMGVGNFFIKKEDLAEQEFSRVFYNWDCY